MKRLTHFLMLLAIFQSGISAQAGCQDDYKRLSRFSIRGLLVVTALSAVGINSYVNWEKKNSAAVGHLKEWVEDEDTDSIRAALAYGVGKLDIAELERATVAAIDGKKTKTAELLLSVRGNDLSKYNDADRVLIDAIEKGDGSLVGLALDRGASINFQSGRGFIEALEEKNFALVEDLIRRGADVNFQDGRIIGEMIRAQAPAKLFERVLKMGVSQKHRGYMFTMALEEAQSVGHRKEYFELLTRYGAPLNREQTRETAQPSNIEAIQTLAARDQIDIRAASGDPELGARLLYAALRRGLVDVDRMNRNFSSARPVSDEVLNRFRHSPEHPFEVALVLARNGKDAALESVLLTFGANGSKADQIKTEVLADLEKLIPDVGYSQSMNQTGGPINTVHPRDR